jgi:predicted RNA binding protein YcfA (HicA-like mRNA interferase family)
VSKVPSLSYREIVAALERGGWGTVRQRGSHIRLCKTVDDEVLNITVPAHAPVKRSTLAHILKQAHLNVDDFLALL